MLWLQPNYSEGHWGRLVINHSFFFWNKTTPYSLLVHDFFCEHDTSSNWSSINLFEFLSVFNFDLCGCCPSGKSTRICKITKFVSIDISRTKWFKITFWFSIVGGHFTFPKGHSTIPQTGHNELVYEVFRTTRTKIHQCFMSTSTKCSLPGCSRGHEIRVWPFCGWSSYPSP